MLTLAADVRRRGREGRTAAPLHVPTSSGWLTLHGSLPDGTTDSRVAIVVQPAGEDYALPLRLEVFGLTPREREIATLVARGLDTAAIAERLVISPWTVQDHLKAIFTKTDTRSRRELLAQVFFHDQLPGIVAHDPLNAGGHLQPSGSARVPPVARSAVHPRAAPRELHGHAQPDQRCFSLRRDRQRRTGAQANLRAQRRAALCPRRTC